jgi:hypothetical protein
MPHRHKKGVGMMGVIKGNKEYNKFKTGVKLTRKEAMRAKCFECNGELESSSDCLVTTCPMYSYRLYPEKHI